MIDLIAVISDIPNFSRVITPDALFNNKQLGQVNARLKKLKDQTNDETHTLNQTKLDLTVKNKDLTTQAQKCFMWKHNVGVLNTLICAGDILYAGGENTVIAYSAIDGSVLWQADVDGKVYGLAIAKKKLLVSTDLGSILCFEDPHGG